MYNSHNKKQQSRQCTRRPNCHVRKLTFYGNPATVYTAAVLSVIALGKAQRILQGESPCRERFNQPPVSSVDLVEELGN